MKELPTPLNLNCQMRKIIALCSSFRNSLIFSFPFEPPSARFTSPVRHPNVDEISGRICLDLLKMPPDGSWRPNISISTVLVSIQVLLGSPNLNDVVRPELIAEFGSECPPLEGKENSLSLTSPESSYYEKKRSIGLSMSFIRKKAKFTIENKDKPCD